MTVSAVFAVRTWKNGKATITVRSKSRKLGIREWEMGGNRAARAEAVFIGEWDPPDGGARQSHYGCRKTLEAAEREVRSCLSSASFVWAQAVAVVDA